MLLHGLKTTKQQSDLRPRLSFRCHLHISPNAPYLPPPPPPQILHNLCFSFLVGIAPIPREIENNAYTRFCGTNKVHYLAYRPFSSSPGCLYQNEVKCSAFDMELILLPHTMKTYFHKKGFALGLILKVRVLDLGSGLLIYSKCS